MEFLVKPLIIRGPHGPNYSYMVILSRRQFLPLLHDRVSMGHFGQILIVVNLVM